MQYFRQISSTLCLNTPESSPDQSESPLVVPNSGPTMGSRSTIPTALPNDFLEEIQGLLLQLESKEYSKDNLGEIILTILTHFKEDNARSELISCIASHLRKSCKDNEIMFLNHLVTRALNEKEQKELYEMLQHMPSSVLGNEEEKQVTRVFVDALKDTRQSIQVHRKNFSQMKEYKDMGKFLEYMMTIIVNSLNDPTLSLKDKVDAFSVSLQSLKSPLGRLSIGL